VQQLGALVAAALGVDEDQQRLGLLRRDRLHDEDLAGGRGARRHSSAGPRVDRQRGAGAAGAPAVAARRAAAAAGAVALLHRRFPPPPDRRLERTLHSHHTPPTTNYTDDLTLVTSHTCLQFPMKLCISVAETELPFPFSS